MRLLALLFVVALPALSLMPSRAADTFRPAPFSSLDGAGWGGLRFGVTTPNQIKARFSIDSHNDVPRSLRLRQPADVGVEVNTLFVDKKDTDPLEALLLRYSPGAMSLSDLQSQIGEDGAARFPRERYQDWWVQVFPRHGAVAFVLNTPDGADVRQVLLLPMGALPQVARGWSETVTPVAPLVDPHAGEARVMEFGTTLVTGSIKGLPVSDEMKLRLERRMVDSTAEGFMRYASGAGGRYETEISGNYSPDKGGDVTVSCTISGSSPYGEVHAARERTDSIDKKDDPYQDYRDTLQKTMSDTEAAFARAMAATGPPTPDQVRDDAWAQQLQALRGLAANALVVSPGSP